MVTTNTHAAVPLAAALLVRADGRVLLAHHASGPLAGHWSLPARLIAADEVAEAALAVLIRDDWHLEHGEAAFLDTLALAPDVIANVFAVTGWQGTPRFAPGAYADAAWADPRGPGVDLVPALRDWLAALDGERRDDGAALLVALTDAREGLLHTFSELPAAAHEEALPELDGCASFEAYTVAEARAAIAEPGHTWFGFNDTQDEADRATRASLVEAVVLARLWTVRGETAAWLPNLGAETLSAFCNHEHRGAVRLSRELEAIAQRDRQAAQRIAALHVRHVMGETDAAADR